MKKGKEINLIVYPLCEKSPLFSSCDFGKEVAELQKVKDTYIIYCFYVKTSYRLEVNFFVMINGKIINLVGESFSQKNIVLSINKQNIVPMLYYDAYSKNFYCTKDADCYILFDDELATQECSNFLCQKYEQKLILFCDGNVISKKNNVKIEKKDKNCCKIYIQNFCKLLK